MNTNETVTYTINKMNRLFRDGLEVGKVWNDGFMWKLSEIYTSEDEICLFHTFCGELSADETIQLLKGE